MNIMNITRSMLRHRSLFLAGGAAIALWASLRSDPDHGLATLLGGLAIAQGVWAVAASHWARKALMDYPEADMRALFRRAGEAPIGAGLALVAIAIVLFGLLMVFSPRAQAAELPTGFTKYGRVLAAEQRRIWPEHPDPAVLAALVEQESCISLRSPRCWNPAAQLKGVRKNGEEEEGGGMGQLTKVVRPDGSVRFDALAGLREQYGAELAGLSWATVYARPDLQLRAIVLMSRDAAHAFRQAPAMLAFGDAAYNGGAGGVQRERRACALTAGCDSGEWFGHVERHCLKSRAPLYGNRSACDINREHVRAVLQVRRAKYIDAWAAL